MTWNTPEDLRSGHVQTAQTKVFALVFDFVKTLDDVGIRNENKNVIENTTLRCYYYCFFLKLLPRPKPEATLSCILLPPILFDNAMCTTNSNKTLKA